MKSEQSLCPYRKICSPQCAVSPRSRWHAVVVLRRSSKPKVTLRCHSSYFSTRGRRRLPYGRVLSPFLEREESEADVINRRDALILTSCRKLSPMKDLVLRKWGANPLSTYHILRNPYGGDCYFSFWVKVPCRGFPEESIALLVG